MAAVLHSSTLKSNIKLVVSRVFPIANSWSRGVGWTEFIVILMKELGLHRSDWEYENKEVKGKVQKK